MLSRTQMILLLLEIQLTCLNTYIVYDHPIDTFTVRTNTGLWIRGTYFVLLIP